jgi:hypothetical protein
MSPWYRRIFMTRLAQHRQAVQEIHRYSPRLSARHFKWRVLTGRGADIIIIDDPLKPEALPDAQWQAANEWYDHIARSSAGRLGENHARAPNSSRAAACR